MSEKTIWDKFPEHRSTWTHAGTIVSCFDSGEIQGWREKAEAEYRKLVDFIAICKESIERLEKEAGEAQRKLNECQDSIQDFVMQHRDDIELHMEDYELLEPILNQILESEKSDPR